MRRKRKFISKKKITRAMEKFDECIIHIGTEKTGTSTLQKFFRINELNLAKNNIFYPKTFGIENHANLYVFACDSKKKDTQKLRLGLTTPQNVEDFRKKIIKEFREEIKDQNCKKLLISTEFFHSRLTTKEELKFLKDFLNEFTKSYKIIVYLRSQIEVAISAYSDLIQRGKTKTSILPNTDENDQYYNYEKLLQLWEKIFDRDNITTRIFSKKELIEGDVKKDFINYLNLSWSNFQDVKDVNRSLNAETQLFLLGINPYLPKFINGKLNLDRLRLMRYFWNEERTKSLLPTREDALRFFDIFTNSNEDLRKKWFSEREKLFDVDFNKFPTESHMIKDHSFEFKKFSELWSSEWKKMEISRQAVVKRNEELRERNKVIVKKNEELRERNKVIVKKNEELRERNKVIVKKNEELRTQLNRDK